MVVFFDGKKMIYGMGVFRLLGIWIRVSIVFFMVHNAISIALIGPKTCTGSRVLVAYS